MCMLVHNHLCMCACVCVCARKCTPTCEALVCAARMHACMCMHLQKSSAWIEAGKCPRQPYLQTPFLLLQSTATTYSTLHGTTRAKPAQGKRRALHRYKLQMPVRSVSAECKGVCKYMKGKEIGRLDLGICRTGAADIDKSAVVILRTFLLIPRDQRLRRRPEPGIQ